jgi:preprotein translocase subunit SecE
MNKFSEFIKESYEELVHRVSWPKWESLTQSTMIVLGATIIITLIVFAMDSVTNFSMNTIYSFFN